MSVREKSGPDAREGDHPPGSAAKEGDTLASIRAGFEAGFTIKAGIDRRRRRRKETMSVNAMKAAETLQPRGGPAIG